MQVLSQLTHNSSAYGAPLNSLGNIFFAQKPSVKTQIKCIQLHVNPLSPDYWKCLLIQAGPQPWLAITWENNRVHGQKNSREDTSNATVQIRALISSLIYIKPILNTYQLMFWFLQTKHIHRIREICFCLSCHVQFNELKWFRTPIREKPATKTLKEFFQ